VAAIDRGWFRFLVEGFTARAIATCAVPVARCLPVAQSVVAEVATAEAAETAESVGEAAASAAPAPAAPPRPRSSW
jgi:general secretion pathway protein L